MCIVCMELDPVQKSGPEVLKFDKKIQKIGMEMFKFWKRLTETLTGEPPTNKF